jgi:hypothetical protein
MKKITLLFCSLVIITLFPVLVSHASTEYISQTTQINCLSDTNLTKFKDNGNGTITDHCTKLLWQKSASDTQPTWDQAQTYCSNLNLGKKTGWKVPTIQELFSIVNYSNTNGIYAYPLFDFGESNETGLYLWSSTPNVGNSGFAWQIQFTNVNSANGGG